ncbi:putative leucine-rich repeat receptor-like serine/threonine-protein kinase At2g19230 isoform X2 [Mercurialis annua]|uniref:putative leucine-rich repeat receptor-like serine/threonine-protein kinase At2g19230 isoform X2 n=1 Tax=Mercurialis annua TaxID=3986 RepID=UPI0024AE22C5|nr:putative leucine-rich repeat receptor-like serine/threonine-protein kinase At2g19230 isoform X2 [Mercurialis annua]
MFGRPVLVLVVSKLLWLTSLIHPLSATSNNITNDEFGIKKLANANVNPGFISIDCGVDQDYTDKQTGIFYKTDKEFTSTGENRDISPDYDEVLPYSERQLKNVRYFSKGRKNCYALRPNRGKNHNYLIRVLFKYGNYDAKNLFPKFDLYLGVNYWMPVQVPENASAPGMFQIIHFSLTDIIYMCLVNTGSGVPFISSLEVRLLNYSVYTNESRALVVLVMSDLGKSLSLVRYKDDVYDRAWNTETPMFCKSINTTAEVDNEERNDPFRLPSEVWRSAAQPRSPLRILNFRKADIANREYYICFHFAEIMQNPQGQIREFTIILNGEYFGPIKLEYLKPISMCTRTFPFQQSFQYSINATVRSHLPPILNALEIYGVMPLPDLPTYLADVEAIKAIMLSYNINRDEWQGDPCMPRDLLWNRLNCSYDTNPPRIISLDLSSSGLTGNISSSFSTLEALRSLNLSSNGLIGTVPEFLARLPNLTTLNLSGNKLTGSLPQSLVEKSNNGNLQLSLGGNPSLCLKENSCQKRKQNFLLPVIVSVTGILVLLVFGSMAIFCRMKWPFARPHSTNNEGSSVISRNRCFSYSDIVSITDNFRTMIGEGGFGKVYFGTLKDSTTQVAVKLLSQNSRQGHKEFQAEAQLLMIVHHKNLVSLIGYCDDRTNKALIYEYMSNGNLREHLSGLEYLHNGCKPPIIHRDFKTTNILLNEKLQAKISDFGLSRAFANESNSHVTTRPAGTFGYLDPQAQVSGSFNKKSDVYSFGIVLLELVTGQPAIKRDLSGNINRIQHSVTPMIERGDIRSVVDPRLQGGYENNSAWKIVEIALSCVLDSAILRPDMSSVLVDLKECLAIAMPVVRSNNSLQNRSYDIDSDMVPSPR